MDVAGIINYSACSAAFRTPNVEKQEVDRKREDSVFHDGQINQRKLWYGSQWVAGK